MEKVNKKSLKNIILNIVGITLCIILLPILIINCTLIVKGAINEDETPSLFGYAPLIVLTESMEPKINDGDLIIVEIIDGDEVEVGMYISFYDPDTNKTSIVTHRVEEITIDEKTGERFFTTKGINNNLEDRLPVSEKDLIGVYVTRVAGLGHVALFMQSTPGLIICVVLPLAVFISYDVVRRKKKEKAKQNNIEKLEAEIAALKAAQNVSEEESNKE